MDLTVRNAVYKNDNSGNMIFESGMNFKKNYLPFLTLELHSLVFFSETTMDNPFKLNIFFYDIDIDIFYLT